MARYTKSVSKTDTNTIRHMPGGLKPDLDPHYGKIVYHGCGNRAVSPWMKKAANEAFDITFEANGGSGTMDPMRVRVPAIPLPECTFTPPQYYVFLGWAYDPAGPVIEDPTITVDKDLTLYAIWTKKIVTVSFTPVSWTGEGTGEMAPVQVEAGTYYTLPPCDFTPPEKMLFFGWSNKNVPRSRPISGTTLKIEEDDVLLYAFWQAAVYLILNQNSIAPPADPIVELKPLGQYPLPRTLPETFTAPEGKTFKGWSDTDGVDGDILDWAITLQIDTDLYAKYE